MNLDCPELIADYHKRVNAQSKKPPNELPAETPVISTNSNKRSARTSIDQQQQQQQQESSEQPTSTAN